MQAERGIWESCWQGGFHSLPRTQQDLTHIPSPGQDGSNPPQGGFCASGPELGAEIRAQALLSTSQRR